MAFHPIDYKTWERREIHEHFASSTIYLTVELDITDFLTRVKTRSIRFYPALIHCILRVVNGCEDYRYGLDTENQIGIWDVIHPLYTLPRKENPALFSMTVTRYREEFGAFYAAFLADYAKAEVCGKLLRGEPRPDCMGVTALPGLHYSGFAFGGPGKKTDLTPFVVIGGYKEIQGRVLLPLTGEFSHAVNDGWHITRFFDEVQENLNRF